MEEEDEDGDGDGERVRRDPTDETCILSFYTASVLPEKFCCSL